MKRKKKRRKSSSKSRGSKQGPQQNQQGSPEPESMSLFGMGLLHRLEEQAKSHKRRVNGKPKQAVGTEQKQQQQQKAAVTGQTDCRGGSMVQTQKKDGRVGYALDDRYIYNFKETQATACFPRQSAQEACQVGG